MSYKGVRAPAGTSMELQTNVFIANDIFVGDGDQDASRTTVDY